MTLYHWSPTMLAPGSVISPGNWGRVIQLIGWGHNLALREAVLEDVRLAKFPDQPSRLTSIFFFSNITDATLYGVSAMSQPHASILYEVELVDPGATVHYADWRAVNPSGDFSLDWAYAYWRGETPPTESLRWTEALAESGIRVLASVLLPRHP